MTGRTYLRRGRLPAADAAAVRALARRAEEHDRVEPLGEQTLLDLVGSSDATHVLATDGDLVGYAQLGPERGGVRTAELVVAPDERGAGLGAALLGDVLRLGAEDDVRLWAHGSLPAASALAQQAGLTPMRELWRMGRVLAGPAAPSEPADAPAAPAGPANALPPGVTLRAFEPGRDEQAWIAANAAAFAGHPEQGALTLEDLEARQAEPWFDARDLLLAHDTATGELLGFAWLKLTPPEGELYVLGVVPAAQGRRLGSALTAVALEHLATRGARHAVLFTDADNARAVRTYLAAGFVVERADTQYARPYRPPA